MNARQFHVPSLAVGILATVVVLLSMSQAVPLLSPPRIQYGPNPSDMVTIREGTPYTVPTGRILVITGLGTNSNSGTCQLLVDGMPDAWQYFGSSGGNDSSIAPVPAGLTVHAGSVVTVVAGAINQGRALGYLGAQ